MGARPAIPPQRHEAPVACPNWIYNNRRAALGQAQGVVRHRHPLREDRRQRHARPLPRRSPRLAQAMTRPDGIHARVCEGAALRGRTAGTPWRFIREAPTCLQCAKALLVQRFHPLSILGRSTLGGLLTGRRPIHAAANLHAGPVDLPSHPCCFVATRTSSRTHGDTSRSMRQEKRDRAASQE